MLLGQTRNARATLESEAERQLQLARIAHDRRDRADRTVSDSAVRLPELRMVHDVKGFSAELYASRSTGRKSLKSAASRFVATRTEQGVAAGISHTQRRRRSEGRWIEPVCDRSLILTAGRHLPMRSGRLPVPVFTVVVASAGVNGSRFATENAIDLPAAEQRSGDAFQSEARQAVGKNGGQPLAHIEGGVTAIEAAITGILGRAGAAAEIGRNIVNRVGPRVTQKAGKAVRDALFRPSIETHCSC